MGPVARVDDGVDFLGNVPLFSGLTKKELRAVHAQTKEVTFKPGSVIMAEGDKGGRFYLLLEGTAVIEIGGRRILEAGPGDHFGEISLLDGGPRTATIVAETPVRALSLASFNFRPLVAGNPQIAYKLLVEACRRLRAAENEPTM
jgi:CRP/FNR family transcriptional regulator, cyclic AMP receptor protein